MEQRIERKSGNYSAVATAVEALPERIREAPGGEQYIQNVQKASGTNIAQAIGGAASVTSGGKE